MHVMGQVWASRRKRFLAFLTSEPLLWVVPVIGLLVILWLDFSTLLAVTDKFESDSSRIASVGHDTKPGVRRPHNIKLVLNVASDSDTVKGLLVLSRPRTSNLNPSLPVATDEVEGASIGFLQDPGFVSRLKRDSPAFEEIFVEPYKKKLSLFAEKDVVMTEKFLRDWVIPTPTPDPLVRAGYLWTIPQLSDQTDVHISFRWKGAIKHRSFSERTLFMVFDDLNLPPDAGIPEIPERVQVFLPEGISIKVAPTDARLSFSSSGGGVLLIPIDPDSKALAIGWVDDHAQNMKEFLLLLSGVVAGVLGGVLGGFIFAPPRWRARRTGGVDYREIARRL